MTALPVPEHDSTTLDRQLEASLREIGIPPRPRVLERVVLESRAGEPDFNYLAELIQTDVAIAAGLIKVANSPYLGYRQKTRNVRGALMMLGLRAATQAVAGLSLRQVLPPPARLERFWDASQRTAELSAWLVGRQGVRHGIGVEDAYTFGLFRDCGIPVMMNRYSGYHAVLARANECDSHAFTAIEEAEVPTNHAAVGGLMAQSWWLPAELCAAIRRHHDAGYLSVSDGPSVRLIALAQVAEKIHQEISGQAGSCEWEKLGAASLAVLDLTEEQVPDLVGAARAFHDGLAETF